MIGAILGSVANVFRRLIAYKPVKMSIPAYIQVALWLVVARKMKMSAFATITVPHTANKISGGGRYAERS